MTTAAHTKGPWRVADKVTKTKGFMILGGHNREVANVYQRPDYMPEERATDAANTHLIAASPDLLEALQLVVGSLSFDREDEVSREVMRRVNDAIAKAQGRSS